MRERLHRLGGAVGRVWTWWTGELAAMLPPGLRERLRAGEGVLTLPDEAALDRLPRHFSGRRVALRVPEQRLLRRIVSLPEAAAENLREVLSFEMDRQTPFGADDVVFGHRVVDADRDGGRIRVELVVAQRAFVEEALQTLAGHGVTVRRLLAGEGEAAVVLAPRLEDRPQRADRATLALAGLCAALAAAVLLVPLELKRRDAEALALHAGERARLLREQNALADEIVQLAASERRLFERKLARPTFVEMLDELTRVVPDDGWIHQLEFRDGEIALQGVAASATVLLAGLEDSALFEQARFRASVTQDLKAGTERFHLSAKATEAGK